MRSSISQVLVRVGEIYEKLVNCWSSGDVIRFATEKWGITTRTAEKYIAKAKERISEVAKESQEEFLAQAKNQLKDLYKKNVIIGDLAECRRIIETANKVLGYDRLTISVDLDDSTAEKLQDIFSRGNDVQD